YSKDELVGKHFTKLGAFKLKDVPKYLGLFAKALKGGVSNPLEVDFTRRDGSDGTVEVHVSLLNDGNIQAIATNITERKHLEEAYHNLVDNSLQGLAIVQDGRMVFLNKTFTSTTGYSREDLLAASPEQLQSMVHPEDRELIWARHRDRIAGKPVPARYEFRWIRKDGSTCWVEIYASRIVYQGRPAIQAAYVDITERKKAEEKLHQYDHIVSSSTDMLALLDKRFVYMAANSSYLKAFGKIPDKVIGHTVSEVFGKEFFETVIKPHAERCLAGE
ncbi:unnamed protein product, partial [marine sediment metagenome]